MCVYGTTMLAGIYKDSLQNLSVHIFLFVYCRYSEKMKVLLSSKKITLFII